MLIILSDLNEEVHGLSNDCVISAFGCVCVRVRVCASACA